MSDTPDPAAIARRLDELRAEIDREEQAADARIHPLKAEVDKLRAILRSSRQAMIRAALKRMEAGDDTR